jgi:hypothetical protein
LGLVINNIDVRAGDSYSDYCANKK